DQLIKSQPNNAVYRNERAWSYFRSGAAARGLEDAQMAVKLNPRSAAFIDTRAHIHEAMGNHAAALADYRAALKIDPRLRESLAGVRRLGARNLPADRGETSQARPAEEVYGRNFMGSGKPDPSLPQAQ
ncbi:MAG: tetratricopeptide repeat protein, partial [Alphaproteobacteria bacterium]|nr:tetratricopeptide repeat protein [Alphaproteobacteria bacterium]